MKIPAGAGQGVGIAIAIGAGVLAVWWLANRGTKAAAAAVDSIKNVNQGTPYEGGGVVGTIGHATDAISGGFFSDLGSKIGLWWYDVVNDDQDITSAKTYYPSTTKGYGGAQLGGALPSGNSVLPSAPAGMRG